MEPPGEEHAAAGSEESGTTTGSLDPRTGLWLLNPGLGLWNCDWVSGSTTQSHVLISHSNLRDTR